MRVVKVFIVLLLGPVVGAVLGFIVAAMSTGDAGPDSYAEGFVFMLFTIGGSGFGLLVSLVLAVLVWTRRNKPITANCR